jgi:small subunit ribosomal protein S5
MAKKPYQRKRMMKEKKEFEEEVLQIDRVTRVVKGGRRLSFRATVIIGNRKGKVAIGLGKSTEVTGAIQKAVTQAKKNILHVPIINETIPHEVKVKFKANRLLMIPASPGTGIKAGSSTRKILELAGIKNILSKRMGSSNRINLAKATMKALEELTIRVKPVEAPKAKREDRRPARPQRNNTPQKPAAKKVAPEKTETKKEETKADTAPKAEKPAETSKESK